MRRPLLSSIVLMAIAVACSQPASQPLPSYGPVDGSVTSASTTIAPVAGVADASRRRLCPTVEKLLLLDTSGNQDRVSAVVAASRTLVEQALDQAPDPIADVAAVWAQARLDALDVIEEANFVVDDVDDEDPRLAALDGPAVMPFDELLRDYCSPDAAVADPSATESLPEIIVPEDFVVVATRSDAVSLRSTAELDDTIENYTRLFDIPDHDGSGWVFTGTYASRRFTVTVTDEGLGTRIDIES